MTMILVNDEVHSMNKASSKHVMIAQHVFVIMKEA